MNEQLLCCVLNPAITCEACAKTYCTKHQGYGSDRGGLRLLKCSMECFDRKSECATKGHEWAVYQTMFSTHKRTCFRDCGIGDQTLRVVKGNDHIRDQEYWIYL